MESRIRSTGRDSLPVRASARPRATCRVGRRLIIHQGRSPWPDRSPRAGHATPKAELITPHPAAATAVLWTGLTETKPGKYID